MKPYSLTNKVIDNQPRQAAPKRKPKWLRAELPRGEQYRDLLKLVQSHGLHTVCEEAKCPNLGECWAAGVATLMILGEVCTRSCGFCHVKTGRPPVLDEDEPRRVGEAVKIMNLDYVVITSVNRDELPDGGAGIWAETIRQVRAQSPDTRIEVLIPDFCGDWDALQTVLDAKPDVLNHNLETVPRLYKAVRPQAKYDRSVELLRRTKQQGFVTKTGIMVGIGETDEEVDALMADVLERTRHKGTEAQRHEGGEARSAVDRRSTLSASQDSGLRTRDSCDILTIGQYLQPTPMHLPVARFVTPEQFARYKQRGEAMGFAHVESGPMVRSSYHADRQAKKLKTPGNT